MELGISGAIGLLFGGLVAWLVLRSRTAALQARLSLTEKELAAAKADLARLLQDQRGLLESRARLESALESERKTSSEKIELLKSRTAATDLQNAFKALAADALKSNNSSFLQIAQENLKAISERGQGRSRGAAESGRRSGRAGARVAQQSGRADSADGNCARRGLRRSKAPGAIADHHAEGIAIGNRQPGARAAHAECSRTLGRNPTAARGRNRGHASLLRLRRAGNYDGRQRPVAA